MKVIHNLDRSSVMVACVRHPSEMRKEEKKEIKFIECRQYKGRGEIILGNRESVRGIETGAVAKLLNPGEELPTSAGQLSIYLNLNMVRLEAGAFQGLETVITEKKGRADDQASALYVCPGMGERKRARRLQTYLPNASVNRSNQTPNATMVSALAFNSPPRYLDST
ncbi:hypothetical protein X801_04229, partial [Opisthorchis viverrini]